MKKIITLFLLSITLLSLGQTKQAVQDTAKIEKYVSPKQVTYTVTFTEQSLSVLFTALEQSDYSHKQITLLKTYIGDQLKKQIKTATK